MLLFNSNLLGELDLRQVAFEPQPPHTQAEAFANVSGHLPSLRLTIVLSLHPIECNYGQMRFAYFQVATCSGEGEFGAGNNESGVLRMAKVTRIVMIEIESDCKNEADRLADL